MKPQTATKVALKHILSLVPTPNWTSRYPDLNRLEKIKVSVLCRTLLKHAGWMSGWPFRR